MSKAARILAYPECPECGDDTTVVVYHEAAERGVGSVPICNGFEVDVGVAEWDKADTGELVVFGLNGPDDDRLATIVLTPSEVRSVAKLLTKAAKQIESRETALSG